MKFNSPQEAYRWALEHGPSDESRKAVLSSPEYAYWYAKDIDKSPRDDTREAVLSSPKHSYWYARFVDGSPRDDTRQAVLSSPDYVYRYAHLYVRYVDGGVIHPDVAKVMKPLLLLGNEWALKIFREFGDGK